MTLRCAIEREKERETLCIRSRFLSCHRFIQVLRQEWAVMKKAAAVPGPICVLKEKKRREKKRKVKKKSKRDREKSCTARLISQPSSLYPPMLLWGLEEIVVPI